MNTKKNIRSVMEKNASDMLETPFTLTDYENNPNNQTQYIAQGTIQRYGKRTNVEVTFGRENLEVKYWEITDDSILMPSKSISSIQLGEKVCVTDPCYGRDVWCMTQLDNVKPGLWSVEVCIDKIDSWGKRVYILELFHDNVAKDDLEEMEWTGRAELGVDSGQMSVFDDVFYRRKNGSEEEFEADSALRDSFYTQCCDLTRKDIGIYRQGHKAVGVVCSSGVGDGAYPLYVKSIDDAIVAMRISFM